MEEQVFVVPQDEFIKYSEVATEYKKNVKTSNDRLASFYKLETESYLNPISQEQLRWANAELKNQNNKNQAIAKRMLAENAELEELALQKKENNTELEKLFALEAALFEWAWQTSVNAKDNGRKIKEEEWAFAVTIFDYLKGSLNNRSLDARLELGIEFASQLLTDAKRFAVGSLDNVELCYDKAKEPSKRPMHNEKYSAARDKTIFFSYDFLGAKSRVSHSRTKSVGWAKQNLQSDNNGHFTRKKLALVYALYMGNNDIESLFSMELENKLIYALGRTDLLEAHQNHSGRARRLSFKRKEIDPIAQELGKALKDMLSTPTKKGNEVEYVSDPNITDDSLNLLIGLASCVSKLETSYFYKRHGAEIENTLDIMSRAYDSMYRSKGSLNGVGDFTDEQDFPLPKSAIKLLQDKDPAYLPPDRRPRAARAGV